MAEDFANFFSHSRCILCTVGINQFKPLPLPWISWLTFKRLYRFITKSVKNASDKLCFLVYSNKFFYALVLMTCVICHVPFIWKNRVLAELRLVSFHILVQYIPSILCALNCSAFYHCFTC